MSADVVQFPVHEGNGAREALERYWREMDASFWIRTLPDQPDKELPPWDHLLAWLWAEGFKIVPVDGGVDPAA